jgi:hypothetical protein
MVVIFLAAAGWRTWHHGERVIHTNATVYEFYATPSHISCELDNNFASGSGPRLTEAYCMSTTADLTHNVRLSTKGILKECIGPACGSNAGIGTPTYLRGTTVTSGPFRCVIGSKDVECTVASGNGFDMNTTTITRVDPQ